MTRSPWLAAAVLCSLAAAAQAQTETLFVKRASELRQGPSDNTPTVGPLAAQTPVTRLPERQGAWMRVKTGTGQAGWVHMFDVGSVAAPSTLGSTASGALRGLSSFFNRSGSQNTTATSTVGIRGLGAEDIANAQPNMQALKQAEGMRVDSQQARRFAQDARNCHDTPEFLRRHLRQNSLENIKRRSHIGVDKRVEIGERQFAERFQNAHARRVNEIIYRAEFFYRFIDQSFNVGFNSRVGG